MSLTEKLYESLEQAYAKLRIENTRIETENKMLKQSHELDQRLIAVLKEQCQSADEALKGIEETLLKQSA